MTIKRSPELVETIREDFEEILRTSSDLHAPDLRFDPLTERYESSLTQRTWIGFQMGYSKAIINLDAEEEKGTFVISRYGPKGRVVFPRSPFIHKTRHQASDEVLRLASMGEGKVALFRCIAIAGKRKKKKTVAI